MNKCVYGCKTANATNTPRQKKSQFLKIAEIVTNRLLC